MRLLLTVSIALLGLGFVICAPVEDKVEPTTVASVPIVEESNDKDPVPEVDVTEASQQDEEEVTTVLPSDSDAESGKDEKSSRYYRMDSEYDDEDDDDDDDYDDEEYEDDEDEDEFEDEEEERRLSTYKGASKINKKYKPIPILGDGIEDDEAEDMGIFEREEPKSDETDDDKGSYESSEEDDDDDDDDDGELEDIDDAIGGPLNSDEGPGSIERGDVEAVSSPAKNEDNGAEQPLAVAVVQPEETSDVVVPIIVEENAPVVQESPLQEQVEGRKRKPTPAHDDVDDEDDDDDEYDDDEDDDEDDDDYDDDEDDDEDDARMGLRFRKRARADYNPSPVLYYYPLPETH